MAANPKAATSQCDERDDGELMVAWSELAKAIAITRYLRCFATTQAMQL
jgi:hypothetical protein